MMEHRPEHIADSTPGQNHDRQETAMQQVQTPAPDARPQGQGILARVSWALMQAMREYTAMERRIENYKSRF